MTTQNIALADLQALVEKALMTSGATAGAARVVADTLVRSEAEGNTACGLHYVPVFFEQLGAGRIDGAAEPVVTCPAPGAVVVDAANGFAHPAIAQGTPVLIAAARTSGVGVMSVSRSTNALALSHLALPLAEAGLIGLAFANAPASMAPPGGAKPALGTNPLALAVPRPNGPPIVVDQSASAVTKTRVIMHRDRDEPIPEGWTLDSDGQPTTDAQAGLQGSMLPSGGHKGYGVALIVEVLAAVLSGAQLSAAASPFTGRDGGPSASGQCLIAIDPTYFNKEFEESVSGLVTAMTEQPGTRLPGASRAAAYETARKNGLDVDAEVLARIKAI